MKNTLLLTALVASMLGIVAPAHGETATLETIAEVTPTEAPDPSVSCAAGLPDTVWTLPDFGAQSDCTANCWDGSQVTCGGTSCSAWDSACYSERGRCYGSETGWRYCPTCAITCPGKSCDYYNGRSCSTGVTCYGPPPSCQTYTCSCFGGQYLCP